MSFSVRFLHICILLIVHSPKTYIDRFLTWFKWHMFGNAQTRWYTIHLHRYEYCFRARVLQINRNDILIFILRKIWWKNFEKLSVVNYTFVEWITRMNGIESVEDRWIHWKINPRTLKEHASRDKSYVSLLRWCVCFCVLCLLHVSLLE